MRRPPRSRPAWLPEFSKPVGDRAAGRSRQEDKRDGMLATIPRLIGADAAQRLFDALGGREFAFPKAESQHPGGARKFARLVEIVGIEHATTLCRFLRGGSVYIPRDAVGRRRERDRELRKAFDAGASVSELVDRFGITDRSIERVLSVGPEGSSDGA